MVTFPHQKQLGFLHHKTHFLLYECLLNPESNKMVILITIVIQA